MNNYSDIRRHLLSLLIAAGATGIPSVSAATPAPYGPVPTENQLKWQDMEMYAFIHYSLNTYTDKEWGCLLYKTDAADEL